MKRRSALLAGLLVSLTAAACVQPVESVRRAALVPALDPIQRSGQPLGSATAELGAGTSSLVRLLEPRERDGANAGLAIPRAQGTGEARFRLTDELDLGLIWLHGASKGAFSLSDDQPLPDHGSVTGGGFTALYSAPTPNPALRIGIAAEYQVLSVPWVEYRTCVASCQHTAYTTVRRDRDRVSSRALALIPSYRLRDDLVLFGGMTLRNHPTVPREAVEIGGSSSSKLSSGPVNTIASAGLELRLAAGPRLSVLLHQPLAGDPVHYGPSVGLSISLPLGVDRQGDATSSKDPSGAHL